MRSEGAEIRPGIRSLEQPSTPKMKLVGGFLHRGETRSGLCFEEITLAVLVLSRSRWEFLLEVIIALVGCDVDGIGRVTGGGEKSQLIQELFNGGAEAPGLGVCTRE